MRKVFVTIGAMVVLAVALFFYDQSLEARSAGTLTLTLSEAGRVIHEAEHSFSETDTLYTLLDEHYEIQCANAMYEPSETCEALNFSGVEGRIILHVNELETDWFTSYIEISVNGNKANYGIDQLPLNDGDDIDLNAVSLDN